MTIRLRLDDLARLTPGARWAIPGLREVITEHMAELPLRPGQGFLIDNRRMLHGRRAFSGGRVMHRIIGDPAHGLELRPGFRPASQSRPAPSACSSLQLLPRGASGERCVCCTRCPPAPGRRPTRARRRRPERQRGASDEDLLRVAELPEVPVSQENCRELDPRARVVMVCRLDVSPAETPRWRRSR